MPPAKLDDEVFFLPVRELGARLRKREFSSVELVEGHLERLDRLGPRFNAVVTVLRDSALREARTADESLRKGDDKGPLHGIPFGAKDLLATRDGPTTWGAEPLRKQTFDYDATAVRKLRDAGAILVAKLAMVELAGCFGYDHADASFSGPCRNPWNVNYWAGGSSSGPGAAVAAGLVPFALGSETSGSIITPSAYCGVSGLRPTYGRVSRHGAMALSWTLDKVGPMCRSADDCGLVLAAIAGRDAKDPSSASRTLRFPEENAPRRFRVGVVRDSVRSIQPEVRTNFAESLKTLASFCDIDGDVPLPEHSYGLLVGTIINAEGAAALRDLIETGKMRELKTPEMHTAGHAAATTLAVDYLQAMRLRVRAMRALENLLDKYDALISPARTTVAYPIAVKFSDSYRNFEFGPPIIPAGNLAGQPALSLPNGFGPQNLPTGIQFWGKCWSEPRLLSLGAAFQRATGHHRAKPQFG